MPLLASADEKKRRAKINQIKHAKITKKEKQRNKTSRVNKQEKLIKNVPTIRDASMSMS